MAQDILDKDNLASLAIIGSLKKHTKTELLIVGFRIYNSSTIPDYKTMDITRFRKNKNGEFEKPNDKRNKNTNEHGNIAFLKDDTHKFHMISSIGFMNVLNQTIWDKFVMEYGGIVDGTDVQSESLRAPFNMSAFTFCKGTYMDVGVGKNNGEKIKGQDASNAYNRSQNNMTKKNKSKIRSIINRIGLNRIGRIGRIGFGKKTQKRQNT